MAFKPMTLDGRAAAQRLLDKKTNIVHACLYEVFQAFPFKKSDKPNAYTSARAQWARIPAARRRVGDRGVPPGALPFFDLAVKGTKDPRPGHIAISLGGDRLVSTDWPTRGRIGVATIGEIERQWNAKYLGWADVIGGHNVTVGADPDDVVVGSPAGSVKVVRRKQVVIAEKGLYFRVKPSLVGKRIRLLKKGTVVTTTGRVRGKWEEAVVGGVTGWLHSDFIFWRDRQVTAKAGLNLRSRPSEKAVVLATLPDKTKLIILGTKGKWREVRAHGRNGWVHSDYIR